MAVQEGAPASTEVLAAVTAQPSVQRAAARPPPPPRHHSVYLPVQTVKVKVVQGNAGDAWKCACRDPAVPSLPQKLGDRIHMSV